MKKQNLILFGVLFGVLVLSMIGTFNAGSGHIEVVEDNVTLTTSNSELKQENQKLTTENTQLKITTDSLVVTSDSLKASVFTLENKVTDYETKLEEQSLPDQRSDGFVRSYSVEVPIPEVSDSSN